MAGFDMDAVMKILNSNVGQSIIPAAGAAFSAAGARQSEGADRAELAKQNAIATLLTMNRDRNTQTNARDALRQSGAAGVLSANPLGDEESFAARRAYIRGVLPSVGQYTSSDPGAHVAKGPRMDTADIMKFLSDEGSMNAITARRKNTLNLDPNAQFGDLGAMGFGGGGSPQIPTLPSVPTRPTTGVSTGMPVNPNTGVAGDHVVMDQITGQPPSRFDGPDSGPGGVLGIGRHDAAGATPGMADATSSLEAYRQSKLGERATADAASTAGDAATQKMIMDLLGKSTGSPTTHTPPPEGYEYDQKTGQLKKKGGGFWKTLGKIGLMAAPIVAAPFTGGASLAAIGALSGAAGAKLNGGGWKDIAMGAGMGAIPMGGGAARTAGQSVGSAVKQAVLNPQTLARLASGLPGPVGDISGVASMVLPGARRAPVSSVRTPDFNPALERRAPINFMNNQRLVGT